MRVFMFPGGRGAIGIYSHRLCNSLQCHGIDVTLFSDPIRDETKSQPYSFKLRDILDPRGFYESGKSGFIRKLEVVKTHTANMRLLTIQVARERPDVVHIQLGLWLTCWPFLRTLRRYSRLVLTVHDVLLHRAYLHPRLKFIDNRILRYVYHHCDALIVHSEANKQDLMRYFSVPAERITVAPHGNLVIDSCDTLTPLEARRRLGLPEEGQIILFFGAIRSIKGLSILLKAYRQIVDRFPNSYLFIAGYEQEPIAPYQEDIKSLSHHIIMRLEFIPNDQIGPIFRAADMVVLPYLEFHSQSGVVTMAAGYGKCTIASALGGLPDIVQHEVTGLLVSPGDIDGLAQSLARLLGDPGLRDKLGCAIKKLAEQTLDWDEIAGITVKHAYCGT